MAEGISPPPYPNSLTHYLSFCTYPLPSSEEFMKFQAHNKYIGRIPYPEHQTDSKGGGQSKVPQGWMLNQRLTSARKKGVGNSGWNVKCVVQAIFYIATPLMQQ